VLADSLDKEHRVVLRPNRVRCRSVGKCGRITRVTLERDGETILNDDFSPPSDVPLMVTRDTILKVSTWTGSQRSDRCTATEYAGDWAFWRLMGADASRAKAYDGKEAVLEFSHNLGEDDCGIPVKASIKYKEGRAGPASSFGTLNSVSLPASLFR